MIFIESGAFFMEQTPGFQLFLHVLVVIVALSQAYNHWGENQALSYFFLIGGVGIFILTIRLIYKVRKDKK